MENVFISTHPLVKHKLTLMRKVTTEPKKFRELVREIAGLIAYEATNDLTVTDVQVQTPLAMAPGYELVEKIGLVPILRSGLGMVEGVWELMPTAEVWHIGLYRDEQTLNQSNTTTSFPLLRPYPSVSSWIPCWRPAARRLRL